MGPGNYFLSVAVNGGDGITYALTTSGTNGVGGPLNDDNSWFNEPSGGFNFIAVSSFSGEASDDFSFGLRGSTVPEPASLAVLGLGALALLRKKRTS